VDDVEAMTGYDFFSNVPGSIQGVIESRVDTMMIDRSEMKLDAYALEEIAAEAKSNPRK
jgi:hypothetical protein